MRNMSISPILKYKLVAIEYVQSVMVFYATGKSLSARGQEMNFSPVVVSLLLPNATLER